MATIRLMNIFPGGKGLNQSIAAARAGANVYHAGCIGNDGDLLYNLLDETGVDLKYLNKLDSKNGHAIIQVDSKGENSIFVYKGTNGMITEEFVDFVLKDFGENDILMLQNEINNLFYIIDKAYEKRIKIVLNPSPFCDELKTIDLNKIYCLILNEVEAKEFTGALEPAEIISYMSEKYPKVNVVLTLGKNGCMCFNGKTVVKQSAYLVDAVDTTAAGDTFTGYYVSMIAAGEDNAKALKFASAASGISVSRMGAAPSIPTMDEVVSKIETMQENNI